MRLRVGKRLQCSEAFSFDGIRSVCCEVFVLDHGECRALDSELPMTRRIRVSAVIRDGPTVTHGAQSGAAATAVIRQDFEHRHLP